nr:hypothetical protein [Tanacetum cinerariifolium]
MIFEYFIEIIIHNTSLNHPCCGTLPSCLFAVIDDEFEEWAWGCELTSFWPAAATVGIPASLYVLAVLKPERLKADRARTYASFKDLVMYQMDVKSAFLYEKIEEEVYVCQPPGFEDPDFPGRVYKVEKHCIDYIKLLEHVYVNDIIFGSTRKELCNAFERLMHKKFQMSSMGELTFFLRLQVKQKNDGIFISQDKYVAEILKKFRITEVNNASTPMET